MSKNSLDELSLRKEIAILWKKKFFIGGIAFIITVINVIWNSPPITHPEYRVRASFIPPNLARLRSNIFQRKDYLGVSIGARWDAEKFIEYLNSYDAFLYMKNKYDFIKMYNIDTSEAEDALLLEKTLWNEYQGHVEVRMSRFESVTIDVWNASPELAAKMANDLLDLANAYVENMSRRKEALKEVRKSFDKFQRFQKEVADSIAAIRNDVGVYDLRHLSEITASAVMKKYYGNPRKFNESYTPTLFREKLIEHNAKVMSQILDEITFREEELKSYPTYLTVVEHPVPNKIMKRPRRLFIAIGTMITATFLLSVIFLIYSKFKQE